MKNKSIQPIYTYTNKKKTERKTFQCIYLHLHLEILTERYSTRLFNSFIQFSISKDIIYSVEMNKRKILHIKLHLIKTQLTD